MKNLARVALALALIVGFSSAAIAQDLSLAIGPKVGLNLANVTGDDVSGTDTRTAFALGGVVEIRISEMFSIAPEALYSMQGSKEEEGGVELTLKFDYIKIPVLARLTIPTSGEISPYVFAGPTFAFKASCKFKGEVGGESEEVDCDEALEEEVGPGATAKSFDVGLAFGGGVGFPVGPGTLGVDARYNLGLSDIVDYEGGADVKNSVIQFAVSYLFPLGR
jgi:opacity protein-like surface antigen